MAAIFLASAMPGQSVPLPDFVASDKVAHFCVYALLGMAIGYRPRFIAYLKKLPLPNTASSWREAFFGILIGCLYALSDEWHQSFVPGRQAGLDDWIADALGIAFGIWFSRRQMHRLLLRSRKADASVNAIAGQGKVATENSKALD